MDSVHDAPFCYYDTPSSYQSQSKVQFSFLLEEQGHRPKRLPGMFNSQRTAA